MNGQSNLAEKKSFAALNEATVNANAEVPSTVNGHRAEQTPLTNGANTLAVNDAAPSSPPSQPPTVAPQPTETETIPTQMLSQTVRETTEIAPAALKSDLPSPTVVPDRKPSVSKEVSPVDSTEAVVPVSLDAPLVGSAPTDTVMAESEPTHQQDTSVTAAEHPLPTSMPMLNTDSEASAIQEPARAVQPPADREMTDAPPSPNKVSRERETDPADEPAAKRTKTNGDVPETPAFKVPEIPTPTNAQPDTATGTGITKLQQKFLTRCLASLKRLQDSRFFREPVDYVKLNIPSYPTLITRPMDLASIERKYRGGEYATVEALVDDFNLMIQNAVTFNGPDHMVSQEGQKLKATFEKQLQNLPKPDEVEEKKPKKVAAPKEPSRRESRSAGNQAATGPKATSPQSTTFALGPEGLPLIRRDSTNADGRPKRSIHPPKRDLPFTAKPKKKKFQWELRFCQDILDELHKPKNYAVAAPFYYPVDPVALNIPNYHNIIKKPMDLATVQTKLKAGQYENAKEMEVDVRQIFKNCFKFNIPGDPTYIAGKKLEELFDSKWSQKTRWLEAHDPEIHQQSDSSDEDSDEEVEDSDGDADTEKLQLLQKQIAEMSKQVEAITAKKKKTPPVSKKSGKSRSGKKDGKKGSKREKKSKTGKAERVRPVSFKEKQIISNGISSLPDKKMQEALRIIQNNVPALKGMEETEIELDIDELPNEVLFMLLKFVKKNAPQVLDDDEEVSAPVTAAVPAKPKKNKPMSKYEQEAQINMLEGSLSRFQGGGSTRSPDPVRSVEGDDSSDESEEDSEESEEE
jgi:bromodomain-containing factor 1